MPSDPIRRERKDTLHLPGLARLLDCRPLADRLETLRNSEDRAPAFRILKLAIQAVRRNWGWLRWLVAAAVLGYLFYAYWGPLASLLAERPDWSYLGLALLVVAASIALTFYRWYLLVWAQDFPFTLKDAVRLSFIGYACNYLGPGATGGDIIRAGLIATEQKSRKGIAMATVLLDRILGVQALFVVGAMTMFFQPPALLQQPVVQTYLIVLWAGTFGGIGLRRVLHPAVPRSAPMRKLVALPKVGPMIGSLVNAVLLYRSRSRAGLLRGDQRGGPHRHAVGILLLRTGCKSGAGSPGYWEHRLLIPVRSGCRLYSGTGGDRHDGEARRELLRVGQSSGGNARAGGDGSRSRSGDGAGLSDRHAGDCASRRIDYFSSRREIGQV